MPPFRCEGVHPSDARTNVHLLHRQYMPTEPWFLHSPIRACEVLQVSLEANQSKCSTLSFWMYVYDGVGGREHRLILLQMGRPTCYGIARSQTSVSNRLKRLTYGCVGIWIALDFVLALTFCPFMPVSKYELESWIVLILCQRVHCLFSLVILQATTHTCSMAGHVCNFARCCCAGRACQDDDRRC